MDIQELTAVDSAKKQRAFERLQQRVQVGAEQQKQVIREALETVIVDRLWYPEKVYFMHSVNGAGLSEVQAAYHGDVGNLYRIHKHAMGQMASVADIPRVYVTKLREGGETAGWRHELLAHVFNEHFHKEDFGTARGKPVGFLRRVVGDEIRGFQGRNFGRSIATAPMLKAFVEQCGHHGAGPVEAKSSPIMMSLKCAMPSVFEPIPGEFIAFGAAFKNSDFGAAKLTVSGLIMRISSGTLTVTEGALSKVHIGRAIDTDDELILSEETVNKEVEAAKSAVTDMVRATLSAENIRNVLTNIKLANERQINWFSLSQVLSKVLSKGELDFTKQLLNAGDDLMDLPALPKVEGDKLATRWWAANLVGWFANKEEDAERRQALQEMAGEVMDL